MELNTIGAVITRSNITRYCIPHCSYQGYEYKFECEPIKDTPYLSLTSELGSVFVRIFEKIDHVITVLHCTSVAVSWDRVPHPGVWCCRILFNRYFCFVKSSLHPRETRPFFHNLLLYYTSCMVAKDCACGAHPSSLQAGRYATECSQLRVSGLCYTPEKWK